MKPEVITAFLLCFLCCVQVPGQSDVMTVGEALEMKGAPPDATIAYGPLALQFGELRLPEGAGPHPVAILVHGGCWLSQYDIGHIGSLADALSESGIAVWNLEYRRVGNPGGGWPGTFRDVAAGADHLRVVVEKFPLDLSRVISIGHSAGGHLALWLAARPRLTPGSPLYTPDPIAIRGVLGLAPAPDLPLLHESGVCGQVIDKLMGGSPTQVPDRYSDGSPTQLNPLVPQILIVGAHDRSWGPVGRSYFEAVRDSGVEVQLRVAPDSGHFEMISPESSTWPMVKEAALELLRDRR